MGNKVNVKADWISIGRKNNTTYIKPPKTPGSTLKLILMTSVRKLSSSELHIVVHIDQTSPTSRGSWSSTLLPS